MDNKILESRRRQALYVNAGEAIKNIGVMIGTIECAGVEPETMTECEEDLNKILELLCNEIKKNSRAGGAPTREY